MLRYAQPSCLFFYMSVKETQLGMDFFAFKGMQIPENTVNIMHDPYLFTGFVVKPHQLHIVGAVAFITAAEFPDISFPQTRKMTVQPGIKVFPVAFPEGQAHVEAKHAFHAGIDTAFQNPLNIFP